MASSSGRPGMQAFWTSVAAIVVGELGDKTQLLSLVLATRLRKPLPIIAGIFAATSINHLIACMIGEWAATRIRPDALRWPLGISFQAVAVWALIPDKVDDDLKGRGSYGAFAMTADRGRRRNHGWHDDRERPYRAARPACDTMDSSEGGSRRRRHRVRLAWPRYTARFLRCDHLSSHLSLRRATSRFQYL